MIEVGEYGRTNLGNIIKFAWIEYSEGKRDESKVLLINNDILSNDFYYFKIGEKIVKHSKNIIDLIEVGDVIRYRINNISTTLETKGFIEGIVDIADEEQIEKIKKDKNYEIKSIVTKEQMASIEYKLEEDK